MIYTDTIYDNKILQFTRNKELAKELNWNKEFSEQDIEKGYDNSYYLKGYAPKKTIEEQNEAIRQARQQAYKETSDVIRNDYLEAQARGDSIAESLKQAWLSSKDKIRADNPYVGELK